MKECLNCKKEFEPKKPHGKFCSVNCRVSYNRKSSQKTELVSPCMQEMFNSIMAGINAINAKNGLPPTMAAVFVQEPKTGSGLSYNEATGAIESSTSSIQLGDAWQQIKKQEWPGWQMKELEKLKDIQQTKIHF